MLHIKTSTTQQIVNLINNKIDFSYDLKNDSFKLDKNYNFIVSTKNIITSNNPSLIFDANLKVSYILSNVAPERFEILGGWLDKETNEYFLDCGYKINNFESAKNIGLFHDQKCIFDIQNESIINIK